MGTPDALYQDGMALVQSGNLDGAAEKFKQAGTHQTAMFRLAEMHEQNMFSGADYREAIRLFSALENERPWAALKLGNMYFRGGKLYGNPWEWNPEEADRLIKKFEGFANSAYRNPGDIDGIDWYTLGSAYCSGRLRRSDDPVNNVTRDDLEKAIRYFTKALEAGDLDGESTKVTKDQLENQRKRLRALEEWDTSIDELNKKTDE
jgi:TPR repeat protein